MGSLWSGAERYGLLDNVHYRINLEHTSYDDFWRARSIWRTSAICRPRCSPSAAGSTPRT